jgi:hypothetical protein
MSHVTVACGKCVTAGDAVMSVGSRMGAEPSNALCHCRPGFIVDPHLIGEALEICLVGNANHRERVRLAVEGRESRGCAVDQQAVCVVGGRQRWGGTVRASGD